MRQKTINIYTFDELTENAQRRAWENGPDLSGDFSPEFKDILEAFENIFDIKVYNWSVSDYTYKFNFITAGAASDAPEGDALRLARYVWNNYAGYITKGKYFSRGRWENGRYTYKSRRSKIMLERDNCPLTGICFDYDILEPINKCLEYKEFFETFDDLITACLDNFFRAWQTDIEYRSSLEYFADAAAANEWEFYENGDFYRAEVKSA